MRSVRTFGFWLHLAAGIGAGLVIAMMSATGAALAFKPQIVRFLEADARHVTASGSPLSAAQLGESVRVAHPDLPVRTITLDRDPASAATVQAGARTFYVDPYTGSIRGESSPQLQQTFRSIENWHRWFALSGDSRETGRLFTGVSNALFLLLAASGLYLWWPRAFSARYLRPILFFRRTTSGKARDFNWHHVFGFWSLPAIVVMTASGVFMSYPALNAYLPGARPAGGEARGEVRGEGRPPHGTRGPGGPGGQAGPGGAQAPVVAVDAAVIDRAVAAAVAHQPVWQSLSVEMPRRADAPLTVALTDSASVPANRSQLTVATTTGDEIRWQPAAAPTGAMRVRLWIRFGHTGELWGLPGQVVMAVGSLAGLLLVVTGWSLAIRRLSAWVRRSRSAAVTVATI